MKSPKSALLAALLCSVSTSAMSQQTAPDCFSDAVEAHVRQQFAVYGPMSREHEYFGFVYRLDAVIDSAVTRGSRCASGNCVVNIATAARAVPAGGRILGEWHTHPHNGAPQLSENDVRGAHRNRQLQCYAAYYSKPNGEILAWDPRRTSVPTAMASRISIGNYAEHPALLARNTSGGRRS